MESAQKLTVLAVFCNYDAFINAEDLGEETLLENKEMVEQEIESLEATLNSVELQHSSEPTNLNSDADNGKILHSVTLSLVPKCAKKFIINDLQRGIKVELRCLPAIEIQAILPVQYPSNIGPLFHMSTDFYAPLKEFLYQKLNEKWAEITSLVLYECVYFL
jgi:hypothetical protein